MSERNLSVWYTHVGVAAAKAGMTPEFARYKNRLQELESSGEQRGWPDFAAAQIVSAEGECARAAALVEQAFRRGVGLYWIHRRVGFLGCKDHPAFVELTKPRG